MSALGDLIAELLAELEYFSLQVGHYVPESVYVPCKILLVMVMLHNNANLPILLFLEDMPMIVAVMSLILLISHVIK